MPIEILESDLSAPLSLVLPDDFLQAGHDSDVVEFAIRNTTGEDQFDLLLVLQIQSLTNPNLYLSVGLPPQDEHWARVRLTGQDASAAPAQQNILTDWTPIGAYSVLLVPSLLDGGVRFGELRWRPPSTASVLDYKWLLNVIVAEHSRAIPPAVAGTLRGVLSHAGDRGHSALLRGFELSVSGPPDDEVHIAAGVGLHRGNLVTSLALDVALDQIDGAAAALTVGKAYEVAFSLGDAGVTTTKGFQAVTPARPAPPAGEALIDWVKVRYQGAPSVIEATDLAGELTYDRYLATAGAGLQAIVHRGQSLAGGTWRYHSQRQTLGLVASSDNLLWQRASGEFEVTQSLVPPETTALGPLWLFVTDVLSVLAVHDLRVFSAPPVILHLRGDLPGAPGEIASLLIQESLQIERLIYRISDNGGGASDETILDARINAVTIYTSFATDDQRPTFPFDTAELVDDDGTHELVQLRPGDVLSLRSAAHPTGGTPAWAEVYVICWRS